MTETQKRIKAYQKALPYMKERVMAVALLFVMSISMMASATFAWVTLSKSPEISGLATTVATNGNLEIALSDKDGLEPDPTAIGDGGGDITETNLKWGNLINLSHDGYGLSNLTLRPAVLNSGSLLTEPLYSVKYANDGRISSVISDFAYTNYSTKDGVNAFFVPDEIEYGVRAISSVTYDSVTGDAALLTLNNAVKQKYSEADNAFKALWGNRDYMSTITSMASVYLNYRKDDVDQDCTSYVPKVYEMMGEYKRTLYKTGEVVLAAANLHYFVYCNQNSITFNDFTMDQLHDGTVKSKLSAAGITIVGLDPYITDNNTFNGTAENDYADGLYNRYIAEVYEPCQQRGEKIGWELMRTFINVMADINSATINGTAAQSLGASEMMGLLGKTPICELQKGLLWNMDWFYGGELSVTGVSVTFVITVNLQEIRTSVKTKVEDPANKTYTNYPIIETRNKAVQKAGEGNLAATDAVAADTYGMVVDFWLRTNAADALLSLAGKVQTERVPMVDSEGNAITDDNGNQMYEIIVLGYSGENRIWEEDDELSALGPSNSQGSGSCYIFYPETPEDQAQALEMLSAMRVAFVDDEGNLLAQADMDTSMAFEQEGRVLVPLQLRAKSVVTGTDEDGNPITENAYYITKMVQNEATRITAIVYLDGARLENSNVLAAGSIKGQLNIQFGTSEDLDALDNDELMDEYYEILIEAEGQTEFDTFDPENKPQVKLNLAVIGMEPDNIKGQFVSYISETQGANQPEFAFEKTDNGWEATVTFDGSGSFKLRNIRIDGVDYALKEDQIITVEIAGITINSLTCEGWDGQNSKTLMTADSYYQLNSTLGLNISSGQNPKKVQAVFAHNEGQSITVDYNKTNSGWIASTMFTTSGTYQLTYIIIDGVYIPLPEEMHKTLTLYLGLNAQVFLSQPMTEEYQAALAVIEDKEAAEIAEYKAANPGVSDAEFTAAVSAIQAKYKPEKDALYDEAYGKDGLNMTVNAAGYSLIYDGSKPLYLNVSCVITDDKGNAMTGLKDVVLHYGIGSSVMNRIDTNLTWNSTIGRYEGVTTGEGRFKITRPGVYTFQSIEIGKGEERNLVTSASSAPKITAISPVPISYIGKATSSVVGSDSSFLYKESVVDINSSANRYMSVVLKDAPSAEVYFKLYNSDEGVAEPETEWLVAQKVDLTDEKYLYYVNTPTDGTWKLVGMRVGSAFYDDVFYDGEEGEGTTGWLDLTDKVVEDNIETEFFTTVKFSASNVPSLSYSGAFMDDHIVKGMMITITDYLGNAIDDIDVELAYVWDGTNRNFTVDDMTALPNQSFTISEVQNGKVFKMQDMNFQLEGSYDLTFSVTIGDTTYTEISAFSVDGSFDLKNLKRIPVEWSMPDVTITAISPTGRTYQTVNSAKNATVGVTSSINGNTAIVYSEMEMGKDNCGNATGKLIEEAKVTLKVVNIGKATKAAMPFSSTSNAEIYLHESTGASDRTNAFVWTTNNSECSRYVGNNTSDCNSYSPAGTLSSSKVELTYGDIVYTINGVDTITIINEYPS